MSTLSTPISRREALQRAALLLGGTLAASTVAGALADDALLAWAAESPSHWAPGTLDPEQLELVATLAERIIPATDTPGARAVGVHRFADALLTGYYHAPERDRFIAGLSGVDVRARRVHGRTFVRCTPRQQVGILEQMDREAYSPAGAASMAGEARPAVRDSAESAGRSGTGSLSQPAAADVDGATEPVRTEMASGWFWRRMKEITLVGYYTSQAGATTELRVNPLGIYKDIPYRRGDREWA